jgi:hypothetical protein
MSEVHSVLMRYVEEEKEEEEVGGDSLFPFTFEIVRIEVLKKQINLN